MIDSQAEKWADFTTCGPEENRAGVLPDAHPKVSWKP